MVTRLEEGKNPEVIIQSPTLDALFAVHNEIDTEIELTDTGVRVIQTSSHPRVVALLQAHTAEVSDMSERGMQAVQERMAGSAPTPAYSRGCPTTATSSSAASTR